MLICYLLVWMLTEKLAIISPLEFWLMVFFPAAHCWHSSVSWNSISVYFWISVRIPVMLHCKIRARSEEKSMFRSRNCLGMQKNRSKCVRAVTSRLCASLSQYIQIHRQIVSCRLPCEAISMSLHSDSHNRSSDSNAQHRTTSGIWQEKKKSTIATGKFCVVLIFFPLDIFIYHLLPAEICHLGTFLCTRSHTASKRPKLKSKTLFNPFCTFILRLSSQSSMAI